MVQYQIKIKIWGLTNYLILTIEYCLLFQQDMALILFNLHERQ